MTQTAKPAGKTKIALDYIAETEIVPTATYIVTDLDGSYWFVESTRPDRLAGVEHPEDVHRPSNCEYAGMGDHSAENCPAGGV